MHQPGTEGMGGRVGPNLLQLSVFLYFLFASSIFFMVEIHHTISLFLFIFFPSQLEKLPWPFHHFDEMQVVPSLFAFACKLKHFACETVFLLYRFLAIFRAYASPSF